MKSKTADICRVPYDKTEHGLMWLMQEVVPYRLVVDDR